jgi:hypothetical protein
MKKKCRLSKFRAQEFAKVTKNATGERFTALDLTDTVLTDKQTINTQKFKLNL